MTISTKDLVSITEANQNFSKVARLADENGSVVILKNNTPRYVLLDFNLLEKNQIADDEDILTVARRVMDQNKAAFEVLAK